MLGGGASSFGSLGDGFAADITRPLDVYGLSSGALAISSGETLGCALTAGSGVKCWGSNNSGQLGVGDVVERVIPVDVSGLTSGVQQVSAGSSSACAVTTGGGVKCWGRNSGGQLGDNSIIDRWSPVDVSGLSSGIQSVGAGNSHACALTTGGGVKCWGDNTHGQVGDATNNQRLTPVDVSGLTSGVQAIAVAQTSACALTTDGAVKCWGFNVAGQLGNNSTTASNVPVDVNGLGSGVAAIAAGHSTACALTTTGGMKCWGSGFNGAIGDGNSTDRLIPVNVTGLTSGVLSISVSCAMVSGGAKCWGGNDKGQVGDGSLLNRLSPVDVLDSSDFASIFRGRGSNNTALTTGGGVKAWGLRARTGIDPIRTVLRAP